MVRKVRIEIDSEAEEEIIIRCHKLTEEILELQRIAEQGAPSSVNRISLTIGDNEYFVPIDNILLFETEDGYTFAHTRNKVYRTGLKLYELTQMLPNAFMRVSKCCVLNTNIVSSIKKNVTGVCEAYFSGCDKKVYVSRMYYKPFREILSERHGVLYYENKK